MRVQEEEVFAKMGEIARNSLRHWKSKLKAYNLLVFEQVVFFSLKFNLEWHQK
jgi:hypothetical protein